MEVGWEGGGDIFVAPHHTTKTTTTTLFQYSHLSTWYYLHYLCYKSEIKIKAIIIQSSAKFLDFVEQYLRSLWRYWRIIFNLGKFPNLRHSFQKYQWICANFLFIYLFIYFIFWIFWSFSKLDKNGGRVCWRCDREVTDPGEGSGPPRYF